MLEVPMLLDMYAVFIPNTLSASSVTKCVIALVTYVKKKNKIAISCCTQRCESKDI